MMAIDLGRETVGTAAEGAGGDSAPVRAEGLPVPPDPPNPPPLAGDGEGCPGLNPSVFGLLRTEFEFEFELDAAGLGEPTEQSLPPRRGRASSLADTGTGVEEPGGVCVRALISMFCSSCR